MKNIALITPLRDEINNIDRLFSAIEHQTQPLYLWIIVENGSTDGSVEKLLSRAKTSKIRKIVILNESFDDNTYALGSKYSQVVSRGFEKAKLEADYSELSHIGILDSDCFPEEAYYEKLTRFLDKHPDTGITSGIIYDDAGRPDSASMNWVRGGCRLWKMNCFNESGYIIGPSADALSSAKASIAGWNSNVCKSAKVISREVGARVNHRYYGYASYFRGVTPLYAILRTIAITPRSPSNALQYMIGYFESLISRKKRCADPGILKYYKNYTWNKAKSLFKTN